MLCMRECAPVKCNVCVWCESEDILKNNSAKGMHISAAAKKFCSRNTTFHVTWYIRSLTFFTEFHLLPYRFLLPLLYFPLFLYLSFQFHWKTNTNHFHILCRRKWLLLALFVRFSVCEYRAYGYMSSLCHCNCPAMPERSK